MAKKVSRSRTTAPKGKSLADKAKAAGKKERVGFEEYDEGEYIFQLKDMTYGTRKDPKKEVFFTKCQFMTGPTGKVLSVGWNVDAKKTFGEGLTNFDLFYWFIEELGCIPPNMTEDEIIKKAKRTSPYFKAKLTKTKTDRGGLFYNLQYAKKLTKSEVAAL